MTENISELLPINSPMEEPTKEQKDEAIRKFGRNLVIGCIAAFVLYIAIYKLRLLDNFLAL